MTKQEKIIVSAYTGVLMCNFDDVHEYIQKKFGRPVFTHELADKSIQKEVAEKSKEEFLEICNREEPVRKVGKWIKQNPMVDTEECSECGYNILGEEFETPFCPNCAAKMDGGAEE